MPAHTLGREEEEEEVSILFFYTQIYVTNRNGNISLELET